MALQDRTPLSNAVLQGILALSSLRLNGALNAFSFKAKAISLLSESLNPEIGSYEGLQALATSVLLGLYEVWPPFTESSLKSNYPRSSILLKHPESGDYIYAARERLL